MNNIYVQKPRNTFTCQKLCFCKSQKTKDLHSNKTLPLCLIKTSPYCSWSLLQLRLIALMSGIEAMVAWVRRGHGGTAEKSTTMSPKNLSITTARLALFA